MGEIGTGEIIMSGCIIWTIMGILVLTFLLWAPWDSKEEDVKNAHMY